MSRMRLPSKKHLQKAGLLLVSIVLVKIAWVEALRLDGHELIAGKESDDLLSRRAYLIDAVSEPTAGPKLMPDFLPELFRGEWAMVTFSMTSMALTNLAFAHPETQEESRQVIRQMVTKSLTKEARAFDSTQWGESAFAGLKGGTGHIGYLGHLNLMLAALFFLGEEDEQFEELFTQVSTTLAQRLDQSPNKCGETYPTEIYVPDNAVVVASIALFDQRFPRRALSLPERWIQQTEKYRDNETGLLPFALSPRGVPIQGPRGSGSAWNSFYLFYADRAVARRQYLRLEKHLLSHRAFSVTGFREFPKGQEGEGDVDSGPVILGLSPSGTGFGVAGALYSNNAELLDDLLYTAELAGFSMPLGKRHYLLAPLVGDAIMLAMMTVTEWDLRFAAAPNETVHPSTPQSGP